MWTQAESSAGGSLTLMAGFCTEPSPKALVAFYGYGDLIWYQKASTFSAAKPRVTPEEAWAVVVNDPISASPDAVRDRFYLHCRQEGTSVALAEALRAAGVTADMLSFDGVEHAFDFVLSADVKGDESSAQVQADQAIAFLDEWLK